LWGGEGRAGTTEDTEGTEKGPAVVLSEAKDLHVAVGLSGARELHLAVVLSVAKDLHDRASTTEHTEHTEEGRGRKGSEMPWGS
jgi:hypothetical protein